MTEQTSNKNTTTKAKTTRAKPAAKATNIVDRLVAAAASIGWVGKTGQNRQQQYRFRGIDEVMRHVAPAFREYGIVVTPKVIDRTETAIVSAKGAKGYRVCLTVEFTFWSPDGSTVTATTAGEGMDYSDKASNKAMSQAFKYALVQTLVLPTDEPDGDSESPAQVATQPARTRPQGRSQPKPVSTASTAKVVEQGNLGILSLERQPNGWWPQVCPYCTSPVAIKTINTKNGPKDIWQCQNYDCDAGQPKRDGGFWPWSSFHSDEGVWGPGGWVDDQIGSGVLIVENPPPAAEPPPETLWDDPDEAPF